MVYDHVCTFDTVTGNLAVDSVSSLSDLWEIRTGFTFYISKLFFTVFVTMVIKWSPGGDPPADGRSTSISTCSSGVNSDLGDCFFLGSVQASTDRCACSTGSSSDHINWPLTPRDVNFFKNAANGQTERAREAWAWTCLKAVSAPSRID